MEENPHDEVEKLQLETAESLEEGSTQEEAHSQVEELQMKTSDLKEESTKNAAISQDKELQIKTSGDLKEESIQEETVNKSNTFLQDQSEELEKSLDGLGKVNKENTISRKKSNISHSSMKSETQNNDDTRKTTATEKLSSITRKSKELFKQTGSKEINNNLSSTLETSKVRNSVKINYSTPIDSTVQIEHSLSNSESSEDQTKNYEKNLKDLYFYKMFPKNVPSSVNVNPNILNVIFDHKNTSFASAFEITTTVEEIRKRLCYVLELEEDFITFHNNDTETKDSQTLADLGGQPYGKVTFKVFTKRGREGSTLMEQKIKENIPTLDVLTVHLNEGEYYRDIVVEIESESIQKQWLGGYRNKLTGTEYHNAVTQTFQKKKIFEFDKDTGSKIPLFFNRDTQTPFPLLQKTASTTVDKATQMPRNNLYISSKNDKIMTSHVPAKRRLMSFYTDKRFVKYVVTIQRAVRKWIMRERFAALIDIQIEQLRKFKEARQKIVHDQEDKDRAVITGAAYPVHRDDFYALFLRVEKWWKEEWKQICETKRSEPKKAACVMLVEKETELLEAIEKHKAASKAESLKKEEMRFLDQISRPTLFRTSKGRLTTIDYLETQKARDFKEIYSILVCKDISPKDRVEMLLSLKRLFENHYMDYEYAKDLVSLIDREIELIGIGFKSKDLKGLQSRIEQLYLNFLHQPEFNPMAKKYKKPNLPKTLHQTYQCSRCLKLLPASKYPVHVRMTSFTQCKSCTWMKNIAHERADMSPFLKLLHQVQNSEMQKCCYSAICFILQPIGMGFLTNVIWHGHSAISECSNISKLHHVRWLPDVEWAPWNTILLTDQEAKLHESIPDIFTFYDEQFIERVRQKHILARKHFIQLLMMDHDVRSTGQWSKITDSGAFLHPSHAERIAIEDMEYDTM